MSAKEEYFRKFPLLTYKGNTAVNLLKRVDFNSNVVKYYEAFYEYTMKDDTSVQNLAHDYYNDVDFDWMIYLANDIIDPYHDVALDNNNFSSYIKKKYGSIEKAQSEILLYKTNYESDPDTIISTAAYSALNGKVKKYWNIIESPFGATGYNRSKEDIYVSTNRVISLEFTSEANTAYTVGEAVYVENSADNSAIVAAANTTSVILKHIEGGFDRVSNYNLIGKTSGANINIKFDTYKLLQQNISVEEEVYFAKYYAYTQEESLNENKRGIVLVENFLANELNNKLTDTLK